MTNVTRSVVILEDDSNLMHELENLFAKKLPDCSLTIFDAEDAIVAAIGKIAKNRPDLFILDLFVRASSLRRKKSRLQVSPWFAGIRVAKLLRKEPSLQHVPIILTSYLNEESIRSGMGSTILSQPQVSFVQKGNHSPANIMDAVQEVLQKIETPA